MDVRKAWNFFSFSVIFYFHGLILFRFALRLFICNTNTLHLFEFRRRLKLRDEFESGPMVLKNKLIYNLLKDMKLN